MKTPQRLREAPDELPRPSAGEQAEGGLQEVLQPQARRCLALLACQEATVSLSRGSLLRRLLLLEMLVLLLHIIILMIPFCFSPIFCSLLWSVYLKVQNHQQMLNHYRMVRLIVMCGLLFMLLLKLWCLVVVESCLWCDVKHFQSSRERMQIIITRYEDQNIKQSVWFFCTCLFFLNRTDVSSFM